MTSLESRFWAAYQFIENFYSDAVAAQNFTGKTSSSGASSRMLLVPRETTAMLASWRFDWGRARHDDDRLGIVEDIERQRGRIKKLKAPDLKLDGKRYWLLESGNYSGLDYRTAANELSLEERTVWEWRKSKGLNPRNGREKKVA